MFLLILGILALIAGIAFGIFCFSDEMKGAGTACIIGGVVLAILFICLSCVTSVPTGNTGIVTTFGKVENYVLDSGLSMKAPWQKVIKMDNRIQKESVTLACFSSDIQEVSVSYTVNYQIDKTNAMNIYKSIGTSYFATVIQPSITEAVKEVTALYTAEALVGNREELSNAIEEVLAARLLPYNINVIDTSIEDMDFTDAFTNAVEAKQVAQQNKLKAETEAQQKIVEAEAAAKVKTVEAQAQADADKIKAEAEAYQIEVKATAEAEANKKISESITNTLNDYYYINQWDGKLPGTYVGSDDVSTIINGK
jgi:regulator of protease activity HflC (stomatin/prohibitin superfamily)